MNEKETGRIFGYARVYTKEQHLDRQLQVMLEKGLITVEFSERRQTIGVKCPIKGEADGRRFVKIKRELLFKVSQEGEERNNEVIV